MSCISSQAKAQLPFQKGFFSYGPIKDKVSKLFLATCKIKVTGGNPETSRESQCFQWREQSAYICVYVHTHTTCGVIQ